MRLLLQTMLRHPRWALDIFRVAWDLLCGRHNEESFENALKTAAVRHGVDYHKFAE